MKKILNLRTACALLLAAAPIANGAQTTFFTDNFSNGSTTNSVSVPGGTATASHTSYDFASSKNTTNSTIGPNLLSCRLTSTTSSGYWEAQALFATNAVGLNQPGDYVDLSIVFTNALGTLFTNGATASVLWIGLYNSEAAIGSSNPPVAGALANGGLTTVSGSPYATGNCAPWKGYVGHILDGAAPTIITRPVQNAGGTTSANQELLGDSVSGGCFNNPRATVLATGTAQTFTLAMNQAYTVDLKIVLDPAGSGSFLITNTLYSGAGTGGTVLCTNGVSTTNVLAQSFDGLAFGFFQKTVSATPQMDVSLITVTGQSTVIAAPPTITVQPVPVTVATNGSCAFQVTATSPGQLAYQWHRNNTNLTDGGEISGSTTSELVISPAGKSDALSAANGYYVTVVGPGGYSTNSVTNSLALIPATNLIWSGSSTIWDLNNTANWQDTNGNTGLYFNYGDPVTFDNTGGGGAVNLNGFYLSAASVTISHTSSFYTFGGSGSYAGAGNLVYNGSGLLTINNANTYTGGTIISNAAANLRLGNLDGLGTGPILNAVAGGQMEVIPTSSASTGIQGDINVADDFNIIVDATNSTYGLVLNGNLSGTTGKTLTLNHSSNGSGTTATRIRVANTNVFNANLDLNDTTFLWALYQNAPATYNGVISGTGMLMQKNSITYLNNANTYSGGTQLAAGAIGLGINSASSSPPTIDSGPIGTGPLLLQNDSTTSLTGSGEIFASGGAHTVGNPIEYTSGSNNLTLVIGGGNNLTLSGAFTLNGNDGLGVGTNRFIQATNTALTTFSGVISDGGVGVGLVLNGNGVVAFNNSETYSGPTIVSNGTLQVNGSLSSASVVTVATNGLLAGTGSVNGAVTVNPSGSIGAGAASIGTLNINNSLTLAGNGFFRVNRSGSASDKVAVSGALNNTGTGTITITNLGAPLQVGDTFALFNKVVTGGANLTVTGGGTGVNWANNLAMNGTVAVSSIASTTTPYLTNSVSGGSIHFSWAADHLGWTLQAQTNTLGKGLGTNWVAVPGTASVTSTNIPIIPGNPSVFYRLTY